jgi:hypothetical protein
MAYRGLTAALIVMTLGADADAQVGTLLDNPTCSTCVIEFVRLGTAGSALDSVKLGEASRLVRGAGGTFVALSAQGYQLIVFDSTGRFLRSVGKRGAEPGDLGRPSFVLGVGPGDSLWVSSGSQFYLYSPDMRFVRSQPLPAGRPARLLFLADRTMLQQSVIDNYSMRTRQILTFLDSNAALDTLRGALGPLVPADTPACPGCFSRGVSLMPDGAGILVTYPNVYRVERYTLMGALESAYQVPVSRWMTPWRRPQSFEELRVQRPYPRLNTTIAMPNGRLAVVGHVAAANWAPPAAPTGEGVAYSRGGIMVRANSPAMTEMLRTRDRNVATVVDLLDPDRQQVVASARFEGMNQQHLDGDLFQVLRVAADDAIVIDIYRLVIR